MLIRDLEVKSGLDRATIRFYEREGLITPERKENGYREYTEENLNHLMKIKLLRQLGMGLDKIKELQSGKADLQSVLAEQIHILERRIQEAQRARLVCMQMQTDKASYGTLDVQHYLNVLQTPQITPVKKEFTERICREYHPFRRFLARWADYCLAGNLLQFLFIVLLKVRPYSNLLANTLTFLAPFLMVPVGALMLHLWGTTPGKWCMGLHVESENGGKLTFSAALDREWCVLRDGFGFGVPLWIYWRLYKSYREYQERELDWDWESEYSYDPGSIKRKAATATLAAVIVSLIVTSTAFQFQPKYRGDLTVAEFSANYNHYKTLLYSEYDGLRSLQPDGTYPREPATVTLYMDGTPENEHYSFDYVSEGEKLLEIHYSNAWHDVFYLDPIGIPCKLAAITSVMSQEGMGIGALRNFAERWDAETKHETGKISYGNVQIHWSIEAENCKRTKDGYYYNDDGDAKDSAVRMDLTILMP